MTDHSLTLGSLLLTDSVPHDDHGYVFNILAEGTSFGVAQGVQEVITSLLADGDLVRITRYGNRQVTFPVEITGPSLAALAHGEAALRAEIGRGNTLMWQAPDVLSVPTVFEVVASEMAQTFNDLDELRRRRTFNVTLTCAPFASSATLTTVATIAPPPATPTTVTVNDATSTTGWSAQGFTSTSGSTAPPVVDLGADGVSASITGRYLILKYTLAAPVSLASTPYVLLDLSGALVHGFTIWYSDGAKVSVSPVAVRAMPSGVTQYVLPGDASKSLSAVLISWFASSPSPFIDEPATLNAFDVSRSDTLPQVSNHQSSRVIDVIGTERTPASIKIEPGGSGTSLGWTVVHTSPETLAGYSPALRQFRTSGNTVTVDATLMSGGREEINATTVVAQVPLLSMPEGEYALLALMRSTVVGTFDIVWEARTLLPGIGYLGGTSGTTSATFSTADEWTLIPIAAVTLPPVRSNGAFVQLNIGRAVVAAEVVEIDEWWSLRMGNDCATTILYDTAAFMWLDSPDVSSGVPRIWVGGNGDRSDAHHPSFNLYAQGAHVLHPGGTSIFVATSGLEYPDVSATYHPRWHSNAAE